MNRGAWASWIVRIVSGGLIVSVLQGCGTGIGQAPPQALTGDSFVASGSSGQIAPSPDRSRERIGETVRVSLGPPSAGPDDGSSGHISRTVREAVRPPGAELASQGGDTAATPVSAHSGKGGVTVGTDLIVGSVLAEVDGNPIYADKVLAVLDRPLEAEAHKYREERFREVAAEMIQRQVLEFIHAEVEFAAAKRNLEDKDQKLVTQETIMWRQQQIAQAGGSLEMAKRKAREDGGDFDENIKSHFRLTMTQLYYQRRVFPLIQISAQDLRDYYEQNRDKEFAQPARVKFRVIRVDASATGGKDAAIEKLRRQKDRIVHGADFAAVAGEVNDNAALMRNHGNPSPGNWMSRNEFVSDKVDAAVWAIQPGELTPIIEDGNSFYLAKLEAREGGTIQPFEEPAVQEKIRETLRRQQFNSLRDKVRTDLEKQSVINLKPDMMRVALDMVMQRYARWTSSASAQ